MKNFDTRAYSVSDFIEWDNNGLLELSPDFQRRSVWTDKAKSYLIDTITRGKPMPKLIITQKLVGAKNIRVVVDGQQRLRAILEYYNGNFKIAKAHNKDLSSYFFDELPNNLDKEFLKYELGVDLLFDIPYEEILDIFARINSYTVKLEPQEIFNAKYLGYFKQTVYSVGFKYVSYLIQGGVLTKAKVTRMAEAELAADLVVALLDKVQTNKGIENFYKKYEDDQGNLEQVEIQFDKIMSVIGSIYKPEELKNTNFSRIQLFYTLFTSIGHLLYKIDGLNPSIKSNITERNVGKIRVALDSFSANYDEIASNMDEPQFPKDFKDFINASRRGTTDTAARILRSNYLAKKIAEAIN
ncbi:DUF262 domain-containing protein [Chryseobacterium formosus]|uniref:DUF262 domain-containing protein n=1 Tax=Chryseobacterium formosus TaxID=1537363 RepID=A0ABT3XLW1_9FLAO|nr:DUF262 domain-containing protein [Chryseobacterium formosus]MCX8523099.1 DUF262 domain-containing protein [Chryseobacterium formosus]